MSLAGFGRRAAPAIASLALSGCVFPIGPSESTGTRQNIGEAAPAFIVPGKTTRAEVLLALGEADAAGKDDRELAYLRTRRTRGFVVILAGGYSAGGFTSEKMAYDRLIVSFDDAGVVTSVRHAAGNCWETDIGNAPTSCVESAASSLSPLPPPGAEAPGGERRGERFDHSTWFSRLRLSFWRPHPGGTAGTLVVGESALLFYAADADARSEPLLRIGYSEIAEVRVEDLMEGGVLAVRRADGGYESFGVSGRSRTELSEAQVLLRAQKLVKSHLLRAAGR